MNQVLLLAFVAALLGGALVALLRAGICNWRTYRTRRDAPLVQATETELSASEVTWPISETRWPRPGKVGPRRAEVYAYEARLRADVHRAISQALLVIGGAWLGLTVIQIPRALVEWLSRLEMDVASGVRLSAPSFMSRLATFFDPDLWIVLAPALVVAIALAIRYSVVRDWDDVRHSYLQVVDEGRDPLPPREQIPGGRGVTGSVSDPSEIPTAQGRERSSQALGLAIGGIVVGGSIARKLRRRNS